MEELLLTKDRQVSGGIDWYNVPIEKVFQKLGCCKGGLTSEAVQERLGLFGPNKVEDRKESIVLKFLRRMCNPQVAAAIIAIAIGWDKFRASPFDPCVILQSLWIHALSVYTEKKFNDALSNHMSLSSRKVQVLRDGVWSEDHDTGLVPGDVIIIEAGDVIPADARLLDCDPLIIDHPGSKGDSLRAFRGTGDAVYAGCICVQGQSEAVIVATGVWTAFNRTAHLIDTNHKVTLLDKVLTTVRNVCICFVAVGMLVEIMVMYGFQHRAFRLGMNNLLILLIGGIPTALGAIVKIIISEESPFLNKKGVIVKRMIVIKEMADMDVLCMSDTSGTLTTDKLTADKNSIEVFAKDVDVDTVILMAARACLTDNQDEIDAAILGILDDSKKIWAGIKDVHFEPSNPTKKHTAVTYCDSDGKFHRVCKGSPEEILYMARDKENITGRVHAVGKMFAERGWRSVAVAYQELTDDLNDNPECAWNFIGLIPVFKTAEYDYADIATRAFDLGIHVEMLAEHKYGLIQWLQARKRVCVIAGDGPTDYSALKEADVGMAVPNATETARRAADIVLTEPGVDAIISAVLTCREISHRIKEYLIQAVSTTVHFLLVFLILALIWKLDFPPLSMVLIVGLNDAACATYAHLWVKRSPAPNRWGLGEILGSGVMVGVYLAVTTITFFWAAHSTTFFQTAFGVGSLRPPDTADYTKLAAAVFLQVTSIHLSLVSFSHAQIWSRNKSCGWSDLVSDAFLLFLQLLMTQLMLSLIAVYINNPGLVGMTGISWGWAAVIWLYNIIFCIPILVTNLFLHYVNQKVCIKEVLRNGSCKQALIPAPTLFQPADSKV